MPARAAYRLWIIWGDSVEKLPFDYFNNNIDVFVRKQFWQLPVADGFEKNIRQALADIQHSHIALGYALIAYAESHTFGVNCGGGVRDCGLPTFFDKCYCNFHLDKSSVSRHVNVVCRFGNGNDGLRSSFKDRAFSFLAELLPLSEQDIDYCLIHCITVADVRRYKAELVLKNKPQKSVATSQQEVVSPSVSPLAETFKQSRTYEAFVHSPIMIPPGDEFSKYYRFNHLSIMQILDCMIEYNVPFPARPERVDTVDIRMLHSNSGLHVYD